MRIPLAVARAQLAATCIGVRPYWCRVSMLVSCALDVSVGVVPHVYRPLMRQLDSHAGRPAEDHRRSANDALGWLLAIWLESWLADSRSLMSLLGPSPERRRAGFTISFSFGLIPPARHSIPSRNLYVNSLSVVRDPALITVRRIVSICNHPPPAACPPVRPSASSAGHVNSPVDVLSRRAIMPSRRSPVFSMMVYAQGKPQVAEREAYTYFSLGLPWHAYIYMRYRFY